MVRFRTPSTVEMNRVDFFNPSLPLPLPHLRLASFPIAQSLKTHRLPSWLQRPYLGEASGGAVLPPGGEVPELDVQQLHQLGHGPDRGRHVAGPQDPFGLLRELPGHDCRRLARAELGAKRATMIGGG